MGIGQYQRRAANFAMDQNQLWSVLAYLTALRHRALFLRLCAGLVLAPAVGVVLGVD